MKDGILESLTRYCDEMEIANEEARKWSKLDKVGYKVARKLQTNTVALKHQLSQQKTLCRKEYEQAKREGKLDIFFTAIEKRKRMMQRKVNGKEIKDKQTLQQFITLYDEYLDKRSTVSESFFDIINESDCEIATEGTDGKSIIMKLSRDFINEYNKNASKGITDIELDSEIDYDDDNGTYYTTLFFEDEVYGVSSVKKCVKMTKEVIKNKYKDINVNIYIDEANNKIDISFKPKFKAIESLLEFCDNMTIAEETKLTTAQRKALPDSAFGLPEIRKYPLIVKDENGENEWNHLRDAIAFFHMCKDEKQRKELATNIAKVIKEYDLDIQISEKNAIRKYANFN